MAKPPTFTDAQLTLIVEQMRRKNEGTWPTQDAIKRRGRCTTKRAKAALERAKARSLQPEHTREFAALAYLAGYATIEEAHQALASLKLWRVGAAAAPNGMHPLVPAYENYTRAQLRALLALQGVDTNAGQSRRALKMAIARQIAVKATDGGNAAMTQKIVSELDYVDYHGTLKEPELDKPIESNRRRAQRRQDLALFNEPPDWAEDA